MTTIDHQEHQVGLISDTHGLLRPQALEALRGVEHILHAGDIGAPEVLDALRTVAPLTVVRGNMDHAPWARALPRTASVEIGGTLLYLVHDLGHLDVDPAAAGIAAVVCGHSHKPASEERRGTLFINPGSAGPRRFLLPVSLARLRVRDGRVQGEIVYLSV